MIKGFGGIVRLNQAEWSQAMEVGERLKKRREELELTQEYVAEVLGVSRQTISNWENSRSYPDIERIVKLSDIYELSLDELLKGDIKMVNKLQKDTQMSHINRQILLELLLNMVLMALVIVLNPGRVLTICLFLLIGLLSMNIFYLIIKKI